jgi:integrase
MAEHLYRSGVAYVVADRRHEGRFRVLWTDASGRQRERSGGRDLSNAIRVCDVVGKKGGRVDNSHITVAALVDAYLSSKTHTSGSTRGKETSYMHSHISTEIGNVVCHDMDPVRAADAFRQMSKYARETRISVAALYRALGVYGVKHGAWTSDRDPLTTIKVGAAQPDENESDRAVRPENTPSRAQVHDLLATMEKQGAVWWALAGRVIDVTGIRWQEVAALEPQHVDLADRKLLIRQAVVRDDRGASRLGRVKTGHGVRDIPVTDELADRLAAHIQLRGETGLLFRGPRGGIPRSSNVDKDFMQPARAASTFPDHCSWQSIRHTTITRWVRTGDIKEASVLAGHSDAAYTLKRYTGIDDGHMDAARRMIT